MHVSGDIAPGKRKILFGLIVLSSISVICLAFSMGDSDGYDFSRREILLRRIGHEVLLQSGDSVSRVLPLKKTGENEYQISFGNSLSFQPDSLVHTTRRLLAGAPFARDYIVTVLNCGSATVAYGYAISENRKDDIIACEGRKQPRGCYLINIKFQPAGKATAKSLYLLGGLFLLAFTGYLFFRPDKPQKPLPEDQSAKTRDQPDHMFNLGPVLFDAQHRKLQLNEKTIELTGTETRVLLLLALSPNETIERSRLQKEIWEDEGVIVGRSLDVFISKLRKKLELAPDVKIVVIRGRGYRLEIGSEEGVV